MAMSNRGLHPSVRVRSKSLPNTAFGMFIFLDGSALPGDPATWFNFWMSLVAILLLLVSIGLYLVLRKKQRDLTLAATKNEALENRLIYLEHAEEVTQRTKKRFLSNLSHEIRTPLNGIIGLTYQLKKERLSDDQRKLLNDIELLTQHQFALVSDVLDYTQLETGALTLHLTNFHLINELNSILNFYRNKCIEKGIVFSSHFDARLPLFFIGDANRIRQVVNSLLSNALKFTQKGRVEFYCRLESSRTDSYELRFEFSDTGKGIEEEQKVMIGECFHQANSSNSREAGGIGIGLSLSKSLVKTMGGTLDFVSVAGVGSTFWFNLSLQKGIEPDLNNQNFFNKILLVEDNLINQRVSMFSLKQQGFNVEVAENGEIAVEKFKNNTYDLILMDIQMPVMDGIEATKIIREIEKSRGLAQAVTIIAITANALGEERKSCIEAGIDGFLTKPFNLDKLPQVLSHIKETIRL